MNNIDDYLRDAGSRVEGAIGDLQSDPADIPPRARNSRIARAGAMGLLVVALVGAGLWISRPEGDSSVQIVDPSEVQTPDFAAPYDGLESIGLPVVAEPDSGLIDGQTVVVRGRGFAPNATVGAAQCWVTGPGGSEDNCDLGFVATGVANGNGRVKMTVSVNRFVSTAGGVFDCAEGGLDQSCVIGMGDIADYDQSGSARIYFDPAVDGQVPPVFTVDPTTELVDGDLLRVVGEGFAPNETALITQCAYGGMNGTADCFGLNPTAEIVVGPDGRFAADIVASRNVITPDGTTDCFSNDYGCRVLIQATRVPNPVELFYSDAQRPPPSTDSTAMSTTTAERPPTSTTAPPTSTTALAATAIDISGEQTDLGGVPLETRADLAVARLTAMFGRGEDSGWIAGCPLDGFELNERTVNWGGLQANFVRLDETETFSSWTYRTDYDSGTSSVKGPKPAQILLPGGAHPGDPLNVVADALGTQAVYDEVFAVYFVDTDTRSLFAETETGPISYIGVPFIPRCE